MARFRIVPERSQFFAEARSSVHPIRVDTTGFEGYLDVEVEAGRLKLDGPVNAHVELEAERLKTGNGLYDRELERKLEVRRYPRIKGDVREVHPVDSNGRYRVRGELTLHGTTKSVEGDVNIKLVNDTTIEIEGERAFDMRDYGLDPPRLLMLRVYPDVRVRGRVVAEREG